jgi:hypothetical protein
MQPTVEQHPLLPSGNWEGFYNYEQDIESLFQALEMTQYEVVH